MGERIRAVRLHEPNREQVDYCDPPVAEADGVLVKMLYAGVNPIDNYVRAGRVGDPTRLPRVLGVEGVGEIDGRPYVVNGCGVGVVRDGTWAELVAVPAEAVVPVPDGVDLPQAASAGVVGRTAIRSVVDLGRVTADDRVVVLGAAGGVGCAVVSLAISLGATVWGQVGTDAKAEAVAAMGATPLVAGDPQALHTHLTDLAPTVAFDPLGSGYTPALIEALAVHGRLVSYGVSAGPEAKVNMQALYRKNITLYGYGGVAESPEQNRDGVGRALSAMAAGNMDLPVHRIVPLSDAGGALAALADRVPSGKLVLDLRS
jgi:NADPH2:quinone reductase